MRVLIGQGRRKALTGQIRGYLGNLSPFRVKCYSVALRLPYLGYLLQILRRGASAEPELDGSRQLYTVEGRSLIRTFAGYATKKPTIDTAGGSKL